MLLDNQTLRQEIRVLIETYWNVKSVGHAYFPIRGDSTNRNILECKEIWVSFCQFFFCVLIETYWNVKYIQEINFCKPTQVLIETYWNVKAIGQRVPCRDGQY